MNFSHGQTGLFAFLCLVNGGRLTDWQCRLWHGGNRKILSPLFDLIPPRTIGLATDGDEGFSFNSLGFIASSKIVAKPLLRD